jgi:hypothetical protein
MSDIAQQLQEGLDQVQIHEIYDKRRKALNAQRHSLKATGGIRGLDLSKGQERGLDMAFEKDEVPERNELNVSFDRSQAPPPSRTPIGSHKGRSLVVSFDKRA